MNMAAGYGAGAQLQPHVLHLNMLQVFLGCSTLSSLLLKLPKMLQARLLADLPNRQPLCACLAGLHQGP